MPPGLNEPTLPMRAEALTKICLPPPVGRLDEEPSVAGGRQAVGLVQEATHLPPLVLRSAEEPSATGGRYFQPES